jgi:outer membrane protein assembly factor BamB
MKAMRSAGLVSLCVLAAGAAALVLSCRADGAAGGGPEGGRDWPHWRGPARNGISAETGWQARWPAGGPKRLWSEDVGFGYSCVSVVGGRAYTMGHQGGKDSVFCFDAAKGTLEWRHRYACRGDMDGHRGPRATPTVHDGRVYTLSLAGHLFCLSADEGNELWAKNVTEHGGQVPRWGLACSPVVLGEQLIVDAGRVLAFDRRTGRLLWRSEKFPAGYATPTPFERGGRTHLAAFNGYGLVILDAANGETRLKMRWKTAFGVNAAAPIVADGKVFISSGYGTGCALIDVTGDAAQVVWQNKSMCNHFNACVLYEGHLYGFNGNAGRRGRLTCLDFKTGRQVRWSKRGLDTGSLMLADGKLIVMGERGDLAIVEATSEAFNLISRAKVLSGTCWTVPVLSHGRIYCRDNDGKLVCVDVSGG